ncbi:MAG: hypothetical protein ACREJ4_09260, partial [Candidatus Methylomirabilaceae bacterium]
MKPVGEPDTGNRYVRFDERGWETERWPQAPSYRAHPRLYHSPRRRMRRVRSGNCQVVSGWTMETVGFLRSNF